MSSNISECCYRAVRNGDLDAVRRMIQAGADVNIIDRNYHRISLHYAANQYNLPMIQLLLEHGADVLKKDLDDRSPLHYVCFRVPEFSDGYKLFLENGANCNAKDVNGNTPFLILFKNKSLQTIKLFLDYGADITTVTKDGQMALHFAAKNHQHVNVLEFVLNQGCDIERGDETDYSALHVAVTSGNSEGCKLLLKRGASVNRRSSVTDETPLASAVKSWVPGLSKADIIQLLLENGADVADMVRGMSVFEIAVKQGGYSFISSAPGLLMQHMARMQYFDQSTAGVDRQLIRNNKYFHEYYQRCLREVERMKGTEFHDNVSAFSFLMASEDMISAYARNEELVDALEEANYDEEFPIYFASFKERFHTEVKRWRLRKSGATIISKLSNLNNQSHPVIQTILRYLTDNDLKFLKM